MDAALKKIFQKSEEAYHLSVVIKAFIQYYYNDIEEFQALLPVMQMLHREIDNIYAELIDIEFS